MSAVTDTTKISPVAVALLLFASSTLSLMLWLALTFVGGLIASDEGRSSLGPGLASLVTAARTSSGATFSLSVSVGPLGWVLVSAPLILALILIQRKRRGASVR